MLSIPVLVQPSLFLPPQGVRGKGRSVAGGAGRGSDWEWERRALGLTSPQLTAPRWRLPEYPLVKVDEWLIEVGHLCHRGGRCFLEATQSQSESFADSDSLESSQQQWIRDFIGIFPVTFNGGYTG